MNAEIVSRLGASLEEEESKGVPDFTSPSLHEIDERLRKIEEMLMRHFGKNTVS
jgi:hypothetical protein